MSTENYLSELERSLRHLPSADRQEALDYYRDYIADAVEQGEGTEEEVIAKLGPANKLAALIITDVATTALESSKTDTSKDTSEQGATVSDNSNDNSNAKNKKRSATGTIWLIILAILASPIALPLAIVLIVLIMIPFICIGAVVIALIASSIPMLAVGIVMGVIGVVTLFSSFANGVVVLGNGLALTGIAMVGGIILVGLAKLLFNGLKAVGRWIVGLTKKNSTKGGTNV